MPCVLIYLLARVERVRVRRKCEERGAASGRNTAWALATGMQAAEAQGDNETGDRVAARRTARSAPAEDTSASERQTHMRTGNDPNNGLSWRQEAPPQRAASTTTLRARAPASPARRRGGTALLDDPQERHANEERRAMKREHDIKRTVSRRKRERRYDECGKRGRRRVRTLVRPPQTPTPSTRHSGAASLTATRWTASDAIHSPGRAKGGFRNNTPERRSFLSPWLYFAWVWSWIKQTVAAYLPRPEANPGLAWWFGAAAARNQENPFFSTAAAPERGKGGFSYFCF